MAVSQLPVSHQFDHLHKKPSFASLASESMIGSNSLGNFMLRDKKRDLRLKNAKEYALTRNRTEDLSISYCASAKPALTSGMPYH